MTRVISTIRIRRDIADVFDFLTTPKNWPEWHPASISVAGSTDHSLTIGEEVTEEFIAAGRRGRTVWRVTAREPPYLWRIESSESEASATITYRLHTEAGMTVFERDMQYHFGPPMISPKADVPPPSHGTGVARSPVPGQADSGEILRRTPADAIA